MGRGGTFLLEWLLDHQGKQMFTDTLRVGNGTVALLVQDRRDRYAFVPVAQGSGGRRDWVYECWTLIAKGRCFFRYRIGQHPPFQAFN
jgi:hypothetical protein